MSKHRPTRRDILRHTAAGTEEVTGITPAAC